MITEAYRERFEAKFDKGDADSCWEWKASKAGNGYGQIKVPKTRRQMYAHRLSYLIYIGAIAEGSEVCHRCDNPGCVNPAHLFLGSRSDNAKDMKQKFRSTYGEKSATAKLVAKDVVTIRKLLADGLLSQAKIARLFGVSQKQICRIGQRKQWQSVP